MLCREEDAEAPRDGCRCRECCSGRERLLDLRLAEIATIDFRQFSIKPSQRIIRARVDCYIAGSLDLSTMHVEIIKALAGQVDATFERDIKMEMLRELPPFIPRA